MIVEIIDKLQTIHEGLGLTAPRDAVQSVPTPLPAAIVMPSGAETGWAATDTRRIRRVFIVWLIVAPSTDDESHFEETANLLDEIITAYPQVCEEWSAISIADEGVSANIRLYDATNQPYWGAKITLEITKKYGG